MNSKISFVKSGQLVINKMDKLTLKDIEDFCAEARRLGLTDIDPLVPTFQGLLGPVVGWHFNVPVVPVNHQGKLDD